jgi:hypothetical protein
MSERVHLYEDLATRPPTFHYQAREMGVKNQKNNPALCGTPILDMREGAWFDIGDKRGAVHYDDKRVCPGCARGLRI